MHLLAVGKAAEFANEGQLLLNVAVGIGIPLLVAFITHRFASGSVKAVILIFLTTLGSLLTTVSVAHFNWKNFLTALVVQTGTAIGAHFGVLKPTGITGRDGVLARNLPHGIGGPRDVAIPPKAA